MPRRKPVTVENVFDSLGPRAKNRVAKSLDCATDKVRRELRGSWRALVTPLTGQEIGSALSKTMSEATLRVVAVRAFQEAEAHESTPIEFVPNEDGWSQPLRVRQIMNDIAGWDNAAPEALTVGTWKTVVGKLRGLGLEVQDGNDQSRGIHEGDADNKPAIGDKVRIRRWD